MNRIYEAAHRTGVATRLIQDYFLCLVSDPHITIGQVCFRPSINVTITVSMTHSLLLHHNTALYSLYYLSLTYNPTAVFSQPNIHS